VNRLAGDAGDEIYQLVDLNEVVRPQIQWLETLGAHHPVETFDTVVDVAIGAGLLAVAPDLDRIHGVGYRHLAANRRGRFLTAAVVSAERTVNIVEPNDSGLQAEVLRVVPAGPFHIQLLPSVPVRGVGGISVFLLWSDVRVVLQVAWVDAGARCVQQSPHTILSGGFNRLEIDQRIGDNLTDVRVCLVKRLDLTRMLCAGD